MAGSLLRDPSSPFVWFSENGQLTLWDQLLPDSPASIRAILPTGVTCGNRFEPEPPWGGLISTAILGTDAGFHRLLPDPLQGGCSAMNLGGAAIGSWDYQGFVRWADGGVFRFDIFRDPRDDGGTRYLEVGLEAINDRGEIVGALTGGQFWGRAFVAGLYWSPARGVLLRSHEGQPQRLTLARDINNTAIIVGWAEDELGARTAAKWNSPTSVPVYLPRPESRFDTTEALAINDKGLIVGYGTDHSNPTVPVGFATFGLIWWKDKPYVLDKLFAGTTSLHIENLGFVNNQDRIAGTARRVLTPADGGAERSARYPIVIDVLRYPE